MEKAKMILHKPPASMIEFPHEFTNVLFEAVGLAEEKVLKEVLLQYLGREATTEDAKQCQKIYVQGEFDRYEFAYNNFVLGTIKRGWQEGQTYAVSFTPKKERNEFNY